MHFHLPKPLHGWRQFAGEVGIIVLGVLIALGAEQVVTVFHERSTAIDARNSVRSEIGANLHLLMGRVEVQGCIDRRLDEIGKLLAQAGEGVPTPHPSWVSRPTFWASGSSNWQAATASGRAALLSHDDQIELGRFFTGFDALNREQEREQIAWAHLRGLEDWTGPLGSAGRLGFVEALQDARYSDYRIQASVATLLDWARKARIAIPAGTNPHTRAICLPITTARATAERMHASPFGDPK